MSVSVFELYMAEMWGNYQWDDHAVASRLPYRVNADCRRSSMYFFEMHKRRSDARVRFRMPIALLSLSVKITYPATNTFVTRTSPPDIQAGDGPS